MGDTSRHALGDGFDPRTHYPRTFAEAERIWTETRRRKLAGNTWLERIAAGPQTDHAPAFVYAVRLHSTRIVRFYRDGRTVLDSGGWQTATTFERMRGCGVHVGKADTVAGVHFGPGDGSDGRCWDWPEWAYRDGMTLHADGRVSYHVQPTVGQDYHREAKPGRDAVEPMRADYRRERARAYRARKRAEQEANAAA